MEQNTRLAIYDRSLRQAVHVAKACTVQPHQIGFTIEVIHNRTNG